jgi:hypothetical protein
MSEEKPTIFVDMTTPDEDEQSILEREIVRLIDKALKERLINLAVDDVKLIARELMPDFDRLIAEKVKAHFYEIGSFLVGKYGNDDEEEE